MIRDHYDNERRVPLWLKLALTAFVAVLVPVYWRTYGPANFLFLCDIALFITLVAVWIESPLLVSMCAAGIIFPQALWSIDFLIGFTGVHVFGITPYMFDRDFSLLVRVLSGFHLWLPILLVWLSWRLGYDRRGYYVWTVIAWVVLAISYFYMPPPPIPPGHTGRTVNVNFVYGFSTQQPQQLMHPHLYFALVLVASPLLVFGPAHLVLRWLMPEPKQRGVAEPLE